MKAEPLVAAFKGLKDPKNIKALVQKVATKVKPALGAAKEAKKALGPFKIPGIDTLIGTLAAVVEIATGGHAGNAILGSLGGVLGNTAGTSIGALGGPPGVFIGSIAGGVLGEVAGRALARGLGAILPPEVSGFTGINGTPLFYTGTEKEGGEGEEEPVKKARGGKIFGGKPTGDSVPAYLERGEYVLNRKAVSAIGPSNLDAMNFGMYPRFQSGGQVSRQEGWDKFTEWGKEKGAKYPQLVSAQWALESGWGSALSGKITSLESKQLAANLQPIIELEKLSMVKTFISMLTSRTLKHLKMLLITLCLSGIRIISHIRVSTMLVVLMKQQRC